MTMELSILNPWWDHENAIELDRHLRELKRFPFVHIPSLLEEDFKRGNLYIIRGPRQVGKTTFLKMLIRKKLKDGPKEGIFYWSCDDLTTKEDLIDLILKYAEFCRIKNSKPHFIILDEITGLNEWQKAIKFVIDSDMVPDTCFILTLSNAQDLKKGSERLPGRRGEQGRDLYLLPLTFREYVKLTDPDWFNEHEFESPEELRYQEGRLKVFFERYLITGGIPLVINEFTRHGEVPLYIYDLYYSWIVGDLLKEGKNEQSFKELVKSLLVTYSTPVSWDSLAKRSSVRSHVTVGSYIEVLSNLFVITDCYFFDMNERKVDYSKNKKIYFYDPFILRIFENRFNIKLDKEKIIEGVVASHLKRRDVTKEVHYTKFKKETDFVLDGNGVEVKYQAKISDEDFQNRRFFKTYTILSKDTYERDILPVHTYLFSLK